MNIAILKKDDNRLFNRLEIVARVEHKGKATPKRRDLRDGIGRELKAKPELVVIKAVSNLYGVPHSIVEANIYSKEDKMLECEPKYILVRNSIIRDEKEEKKEEAPAEAPKEKAPAEEVKGELPKEDKPKPEKEIKKEEEVPKKEAPKKEVKEDGKEEKGSEDKGKEGKEDKKAE
jgi:small subunit ribosomal protein S24e